MLVLADPALARCASLNLQPQPDPEPIRPLASLPEGSWSASSHIAGTGAGVDAGLTYLWTGGADTYFDMESAGEQGPITGTWTLIGNATQSVEGSSNGVPVTGNGQMVMTGNGTVTGAGKALTVAGSGHSSGSVTATTPRGSHTQPIDTAFAITAEIFITYVACDEAIGTWSVDPAGGGPGPQITLTGVWNAWRLEAGDQAEAANLLSQLTDGDVSTLPDSPPSPHLVPLTQILTEYETFVASYPAWTPDSVYDMFKKVEEAVNSLRNLSPCERQLIGEGTVDAFRSFGTSALQELIIRGSALETVSGQDLQALTNAAVRTGVIGSGAADQSRGGAAENGLHGAAESILARNVDTEGNLQMNAESRVTMATAAAMGWNVRIDGDWVDARATWNQTFGASGDSWDTVVPDLAGNCS